MLTDDDDDDDDIHINGWSCVKTYLMAREWFDSCIRIQESNHSYREIAMVKGVLFEQNAGFIYQFWL